METLGSLALGQLGVALALRTGRRRFTGNPFLTVAVAADAALVFGALYWAPLQALLGTEPLGPTDLALVAAASLAGAAAVAAERGLTSLRQLRRKHDLRTGGRSP